MRRYRFTLSWTSDEEFGSSDRAKENLQEIWNEIEALAGQHVGEGNATLETFDVTPLPRDRGDSRELRITTDMTTLEGEPITLEPATPAAIASMVPEAGVIHPWDQGLWIFPEDHVLREYEDLARNKRPQTDIESMEYHKEKHIFLEVGRRLELTP